VVVLPSSKSRSWFQNKFALAQLEFCALSELRREWRVTSRAKIGMASAGHRLSGFQDFDKPWEKNSACGPWPGTSHEFLFDV